MDQDRIDKLVAAFRLGLLEGFKRPEVMFSGVADDSGLTFGDKVLHEVFDSGVNIGQVEASGRELLDWKSNGG